MKPGFQEGASRGMEKQTAIVESVEAEKILSAKDTSFIIESLESGANYRGLRKFLEVNNYTAEPEVKEIIDQYFAGYLRGLNEGGNLLQAAEQLGYTLDFSGAILKEALRQGLDDALQVNDLVTVRWLQKVSGQELIEKGDARMKLIADSGYASLLYNLITEPEKLENLFQFTGFKPDFSQPEIAELVSSAYSNLISAGYYKTLDSVAEFMGVQPDYQNKLKSAVMDRYRNLILQDAFDDQKKLARRTQIQPDFKGELRDAVIARYKLCLSRPKDYKNIIKLVKRYGVELDFAGEFRAHMADIFKSYIAAGDWRSISDLELLTGQKVKNYNAELSHFIQSELYTEIINGFSSAVKYGRFVADDKTKLLRDIAQNTGIGPDFNGVLRPLVIQCYKLVLQQDQGGVSLLDVKIQDVREWSGIEPDFKGELRQDFLRCVKGLFKSHTNIINIKQVVGQELIEFREDLAETVQAEYGWRILNLTNLNSLANEIALLKSYTGVEPDFTGQLYSVVQQRYVDMIGNRVENRNPLSTDFEQLRRISGVAPDFKGEANKKVQMAQLSNLAHSGSIIWYKKITALTGVELDLADAEIKNNLENLFQGFLHDHRLPALVQCSFLFAYKIDYHSVRFKRVINENFFLYNVVDLKELNMALKEPLDFNDPELKQIVQKKYKNLISNEKLWYVADMEAFTGVKADYQGELKEDVEKVFLKRIKSFDLSSFSALIKTVGFTPDFSQKKFKDAACASVAGWIEHLLLNGKIGNVDHLFAELLERFDLKGFEPEIIKRICGIIRTDFNSVDLKEMENVFLLFKEENRAEIRRLVKEKISGDISAMLARGNYKAVEEITQMFGIVLQPHDLQTAMADNIARGLIPTELVQLMLRNNVKFEIKAEAVEQMHINSPRIGAIIYLTGLPKDKAENELTKQALFNKSKWFSAIPKLLEIQGPAARADFCPWQTELNPLLLTLGENLFLPQDVDESGEKAEQNLALVEFVEKFGMVNLPELAGTIIALRTYHDNKKDSHHWGESGANLQKFWRAHGLVRSLEDLKYPEVVDLVISELETAMNDMKRALLRDEIPAALESSLLDMELFNAIVVRGKHYGNLSGRESVISTWRQTKHQAAVSGKPESVELPAYYPDKFNPPVFNIHALSREVSFADLLEQLQAGDSEAGKKRDEQIAELEIKKAEMYENQPMDKFIRPFMRSVGDLNRFSDQLDEPKLALELFVASLEGQVTKLNERLGKARQKEGGANPRSLAGLEQKIGGTQEKINQVRELMEEEEIIRSLAREMDRLQQEITALPKDKSTAYLELTADLQSLQILAEKFARNDLGENEKHYIKVQAQLEALRLKFGRETLIHEADDTVRLLVLRLMQLESPGHFSEIIRAQTESQGNINEQVLQAWSQLFSDELLLHFANQKQFHQNIRTAPFSSGLMSLVDSLWRITGKKSELGNLINPTSLSKNKSKETKPAPSVSHEFFTTVQEAQTLARMIYKLKNPNAVSSERDRISAVPVTFNACHGLGRIFSGDIGDSCHDSQKIGFAKNEYPNLNAVLMTQEEEKTIRILGSFLLINGKDKVGKSFITVRALNPLEAVVQRELSSKDIVKTVIDYVTAVARKGNFDYAMMCLGRERGTHGSNRQNVFDAMTSMLGKLEPNPELVSTPETNFNNYAIWHPGECRVVWKK